MPSRALRNLSTLELEERILNAGALVAALSVFFPWFSGEWLTGDSLSYTGFGFFTSFLGIAIFLLNLGLLLIVFVPLFGGPVIIRKRYREMVRLCITTQSTILVLAALSVLTKVSFEFSRMEVRFGIYLCLIGNIVALFEAVLRFHEQRRSNAQELFHHPEDHSSLKDRKETPITTPPPPPPPPPLQPEEHPLYP